MFFERGSAPRLNGATPRDVLICMSDKLQFVVVSSVFDKLKFVGRPKENARRRAAKAFGRRKEMQRG